MSMHPLYDTAVEADEAFSVELVRVFGARKAPDMRYRPEQWPTDHQLSAAAAAKILANREWLKRMRGEINDHMENQVNAP